ncbi:MAG: hypothetical protein HY898_09620 [Deltaproteobacteria bacterium]|nr:hypothetical protein [Deltaproteobacteria bacterium]
MNISLPMNHAASRYAVAQELDRPEGSAQDVTSEVERSLSHEVYDPVSKPAAGVDGLPKGGPGDVLSHGKDSKVGGFGLGTGHTMPGIDVLSGSILSDLAAGISGDALGDAQAVAEGEWGAGSVSPGADDLLNQSIDRWGGAVAEGPIARGAAAGGAIGCAVGWVAARSPAGCATGAAVGSAIGGAIGLAVDLATDTSGKGGSCGGTEASPDTNENTRDASVESSAESKPEDKSETDSRGGCDPLIQSCPGQPEPEPSDEGMGDDQDGAKGGDPFLTSIALRHRAGQGDAAARRITDMASGNHGGMVPEWAVQPDTEDRRGQGTGDSGALKRIERLGDDFDGVSYYQQAAAAPPHSFEEALKASISNPVVNPIPC